MQLRVSSVTAKRADTGIRVQVSADVNTGYAAGAMTVHWNQDALVLRAVEFNAKLAPDNQSAPLSNSGSYHICFGSYLAEENFTGTGRLYTLIFDAAENAEPDTYAITFDKFDILDKEINKVTVSCTNGAVTLEEGDIPAFLLGDVNRDGEVSVDDAQITLKAYTARMVGNEMELNDNQIKAADVNGNKEISVDDAQLILIYYVKNTLANNPTTWETILSGIQSL